MDEEFIDLLCETIRFQKSVKKLWESRISIDGIKNRKMDIANNRLTKKIEKLCDRLHVEIIDKEYENTEYDVGIPVDPLNLDDFDKNEKLYIGTMLEPIIKEKGTANIIKNGKAVLVAK
ncbi:hypothetical protein [uncultured Dialister sp.]|uniref:hypothetical protein n=1 Tax=uncultured Dialister sp. TaxID=278064 RepID=UPI0025E9149C|nr:hypothetical protein [uncultured Dialister sp.]